jgi:hypothetical protein
MNRYIPKSARETLESYEWLYRDKLESLDHLTRQLWRDLVHAGVRSSEVRDVISDYFAGIWEQVAEE